MMAYGHRTHAGLDGGTPEPSTQPGSARAREMRETVESVVVGARAWRAPSRGVTAPPVTVR